MLIELFDLQKLESKQSMIFIKTMGFFNLDLFQKLFRQDLLVASLFRNILLAERVMRSYNCTPVTCPKLPSTYHNPMWYVSSLLYFVVQYILLNIQPMLISKMYFYCMNKNLQLHLFMLLVVCLFSLIKNRVI